MTSGNNSKKDIKQILGYSFTISLSVLFLYIAFKNVEFDKVLFYLTDISLIWVLPFLFIFLLSHYLRAVRWKVMISSFKPEASYLNLFTATMIGYGVNCVIPRLGEFYRGMFLGKLENLSRSSMFGTIIVERVIDILMLGFSVLVSVAIYPGNLYEEFLWLKSALVIGFIGIFSIIIILVFVVRLKEKFYNIILRFVGKFSNRIADKLGYIFKMVAEGFGSINSWPIFLNTIILSVLLMLVYGLTSYFAFFLLKMNDLQPVSYAMAWILMTISAFGIIIPTPGGTGSYHLININVLTLLFGFSNEISSAYAILTHSISYILFLVSPFVLIYFVNLKRKHLGESKVNFINVLKLKSEK